MNELEADLELIKLWFPRTVGAYQKLKKYHLDEKLEWQREYFTCRNMVSKQAAQLADSYQRGTKDLSGKYTHKFQCKCRSFVRAS